MMARLLVVAGAALLAACAVSTDYDPYVAAVGNQLERRSYQTREIAEADYQRLVSAVIGTLQDYHFRIVDVDPDLGIVTAYQLTSHQEHRRFVRRTDLTVVIRERGERRFSVRMNMTTGLESEDSAALYSQFFSALDRKLHYQTSASAAGATRMAPHGESGPRQWSQKDSRPTCSARSANSSLSRKAAASAVNSSSMSTYFFWPDIAITVS